MWNGFLVFARTVSAGFPSSFIMLRGHAFKGKDVLFAAKEVRKASYKHSGSIVSLFCTHELHVNGGHPASAEMRDNGAFAGNAEGFPLANDANWLLHWHCKHLPMHRRSRSSLLGVKNAASERSIMMESHIGVQIENGKGEKNLGVNAQGAQPPFHVLKSGMCHLCYKAYFRTKLFTHRSTAKATELFAQEFFDALLLPCPHNRLDSGCRSSHTTAACS
jgi:hypothetical protein